LPYKYFIAFVGASGLSAAVSFMGQKFWVFKTSDTVMVH
jgi:putative flippase GtrA